MTQVPYVRDAIVNSVCRHISKKRGLSIAIERISGFLPFNLNAELITIGDAEGRFLRIEDVSLQGFHYKAPFINHFIARSFNCERLPNGEKNAQYSSLSSLAVVPQIKIKELKLPNGISFSEVTVEHKTETSLSLQGTSSYGMTLKGELTPELFFGSMQSFDLGTLSFSSQYLLTQENLKVRNYRIEGDGLNVAGHHTFPLNQGASQGEISFEIHNFRPFLTQFGVAGNMTGTAKLTPEGSIHINVQSGQLLWNEIRAHELNGSTTWHAKTGWNGTFQCNSLAWKALQLESLIGKVETLSQGLGLDIKTSPTSQGGRLSLKALLSKASVQLSAADYKDSKHQVALAKPVTWSYQNLWPQSVLELRVGEGNFTLLPAENEGQEVTFTLNRIPLTIFALMKDQWALEGTLSGQGTLNRAMDSYPYQFKVMAQSFYKYGHTELMKATTQAEFRGDSAGLKWNLITKGANHLHLIGEGTWEWNSQAFTSSVKGVLTLDVLNPFLAYGDRLQGQVNLNLQARGTYDQPHLSGAISLTNGYYENGFLGTIVQDICFKGHIEESLLSLPKITARDISKGIVEAKGTIHIQKEFIPSFNLTANLQHFVLAQSDALKGIVNGQISLKGAGSQAELRGDLEAISLIYDFEIRNPRTQALRIKGERPKVNIVPQKSRTGIPLSLKISLQHPLTIRSHNLKSHWNGDLSIEGMLSEPQVLGGLTFVDGHFEFLGKHLKLTEGSIQFDKDHLNDPQLDIRSTREGTEITVYFQISGRASNPAFSFTSLPPLPMEEILARIIFNKSLGKTSSSQSLQVATVLSSLQQAAGGMDIFNKLQSVFGLDVIEFKQPESDPYKTSLQGSVAIRKQLTERVSMSVEGGLGTDANKVGAEIKLTPNFSLEADVSSSENIGAGLNWSKRY